MSAYYRGNYAPAERQVARRRQMRAGVQDYLEGGEAGDHAKVHGALQHALVPQAQLGGRHGLVLVLRVVALARKDVVGASRGRGHPEVRVLKAAVRRVLRGGRCEREV